MNRKAYPSDVKGNEWAFIAPYLIFMNGEAPQREHSLRKAFNGLRWIVRSGAPWGMIPHDLPPCKAVYQQIQRWLYVGVFEAIVDELQVLLRLAEDRAAEPSAVIMNSRTMQSIPESGGRAGSDRAKCKLGSMDIRGSLLALSLTPAYAQYCSQLQQLTQQVQQLTGKPLEVALVDQGYSGEHAARAISEQGIRLEVVRLPEAMGGFVLLPLRWVVECSFAWSARFSRLAKGYERLKRALAKNFTSSPLLS